jgi:hypothetical protein
MFFLVTGQRPLISLLVGASGNLFSQSMQGKKAAAEGSAGKVEVMTFAINHRVITHHFSSMLLLGGA